MRTDQLAYIGVIAENMAGMAYAMKLCQEKDDFEGVLQILVDMNINTFAAIRSLGVSRTDFLYRCNLRRAKVEEKMINSNLIIGGLVLPAYKAEDKLG